ncbi:MULTISPECIES: 23S rRNA (adenine(2503)-C(2))-methyltransferase RlmN [Sphingobacterium]|uniref:Probable dual-specificity RNA methyltransferase RlmN n=2 Tax=Sphingobacterium TaxID=28453 RepID=A0ABW5YRT2_9SPHI|nr:MULTISPECIES: 23S rRNA (adenine(2503)-C(2))-methyltransferase RlmN [Sphingobacterium]KKX47994.1 50S rRNA methyltransferase [Sphingobacterium sp. IITKGP-BTPF85]MBB2953229.1 23S rRNA (adenine2503-C2)-methyltransferase [Sphingobacterium sp. JUb56]MCS3555332.1 23S rRNA (adenine2503-C2)-methyltransferase [Sphingobacterium sp. JUb21]MCW2261672.1 23S rRNA (adenine2503-C2)-methyltransferase [Sphingobacterium kitahiroshimense]NJI75412.1 23S rRNA (adenine(2503)-C(2))-methyltransferase RlmN [Sphingoba
MTEKSKIIDIRSLSIDQIKEKLTEMGEQGFRAKQIYEWIWAKSCVDFDLMSNLSKPLREKLKENFVIRAVKVKQSQVSSDRTIKSSFTLYDGNVIEGVLIPAPERMTACVSSQVGCSLTCKFCATGYMDRKRNLNADEIYDQVVLIAKQAEEKYQQPLTNIVYMGMGEPLLNYANMMKSVERITSPDGLNMAAKRITVSTAGIAKMIKKLGDDEVRFNLALSLHAANDKKRNEIMPINEQNTLEALADALKYFYAKTKSPITFEYIVFDNFNDELEDAKELARFCKNVPCKVNIIEYNPISLASFVNADADKIEVFANYLKNQGIITNVRRSRGKDIDAACGQLAIKDKEAQEA